MLLQQIQVKYQPHKWHLLHENNPDCTILSIDSHFIPHPAAHDVGGPSCILRGATNLAFPDMKKRAFYSPLFLCSTT